MAHMPWNDRLKRRLKLRDLDILTALLDTGSMGKAANRLGVSQPAVSKAIAELERTLGVRLVDRSRRRPVAIGVESKPNPVARDPTRPRQPAPPQRGGSCQRPERGGLRRPGPRARERAPLRLTPYPNRCAQQPGDQESTPYLGGPSPRQPEVHPPAPSPPAHRNSQNRRQLHTFVVGAACRCRATTSTDTERERTPEMTPYVNAPPWPLPRQPEVHPPAPSPPAHRNSQNRRQLHTFVVGAACRCRATTSTDTERERTPEISLKLVCSESNHQKWAA